MYDMIPNPKKSSWNKGKLDMELCMELDIELDM